MGLPFEQELFFGGPLLMNLKHGHLKIGNDRGLQELDLLETNLEVGTWRPLPCNLQPGC